MTGLKRYCNILSEVIKEAKKRHYDNQIKNSTNKEKNLEHSKEKTHRKAHSTNINIYLPEPAIALKNREVF